ncbi:MAG: helix-turn-helix domain-containing protein, partial [Proteobacteria bacterium]|nr:helix-turn-helix domain-containing protein [Pseudomonadota bacterium]
GISQYRLAKATGLALIHISELVRGKRNITAETALRLQEGLWAFRRIPGSTCKNTMSWKWPWKRPARKSAGRPAGLNTGRKFTLN